MNIQTEKIQLVKMLLDTENPKIIESIKEIEKASIEIENGEVTDYESFMQKHR